MFGILLLAALQNPAGCAGAPSWTEPFAPHLADSARIFRGTFSPDGRTFYYFRKQALDREDYRIMVSRWRNGAWMPGERLDLGGEFSDLYPSVSPDGRRLVFASYRPAPGDTASRPNAYLWYADRRGEGWGPPVFIGPSARFGTYHSGPIIGADLGIRFTRTSADWRTRWAMRTRWTGRAYAPAEEMGTADPAAPWRTWRPGELFVWGGQRSPDGNILLLDVSPIEAGGRRGPAQVWVSLRQGDTWTEPVPAGGGVNQGFNNFVVWHPDGCSIVFVRDFTGFHQVSVEALAAPARARGGRVGVTPLPRIEGNWQGAYVRGGSVQVVSARFQRQRDTLVAFLSTPDWPHLPARRAVVTRDPAGRYRFPTPFGMAVVRLDSLHGELAGAVGENAPPVSLHLKRALRDPVAVHREEVTATSGGVALSGTLVRPREGRIVAAMVMVPGRGCASRVGGVRQLELLAAYGIAGVAFDKRGVGRSGGNCRFATIDDLTGDALAAYEVLASRFAGDSTALGFHGNSAGGWVVVRAAARSPRPVDFLVTSVGPAVSVEQQQRDNAGYVTRRLGMSPDQTARAMRYLDLMFAEGNQTARHAEMQETVAWARRVGFADQFFEESDIPSSPAAVDSLWVTLNDYDPAPDLARLRLRMLAFFGEADEVVPPQENVTALRRIAAGNPGLDATIVVVPGGNHGLGVAEGVTELGRRDRAFRFDRHSPVYWEKLIAFLTQP